MQWTDLENYRQLLQQYESRLEGYQRRVADYRESQAAGNGDPQLKQQLDAELEELQGMYDRLAELRLGLAQSRDAVAQ